MLPFKTPLLIKMLKPSLIWDVKKGAEPTIYLTFDDGPIPEITEFVLDSLAQFNAKATFFCIGDNVKKHPVIFKKIIKAEHCIGNHTFNHLKGSETETEDYLQNVDLCDAIFEKEMGRSSTLFRPPYGRLKEKQRKSILQHKKIIMWDVLSQDYDQAIAPEFCLEKTIKSTKDGSIVLFHDSQKAWKNMQFILKPFLSHFSELGFKFGVIPV